MSDELPEEALVPPPVHPPMRFSPAPPVPAAADRTFQRYVQQVWPCAKPSDDAEGIRQAAAQVPTTSEGLRALRARMVEFADALAKLDAKLAPGEHNPKDADIDIMGVGQCDGVFWLGQNILTMTQDAYRKALRYLRPMPAHWQKAMGNVELPEHMKTQPGQRARFHRTKGVSKPGWPDVPWTQALNQAARETGRTADWLFTQEPHCIDAVQDAHCLRWRCYRVEEDVWAVLYV